VRILPGKGIFSGQRAAGIPGFPPRLVQLRHGGGGVGAVGEAGAVEVVAEQVGQVGGAGAAAGAHGPAGGVVFDHGTRPARPHGQALAASPSVALRVNSEILDHRTGTACPPEVEPLKR